MEKNCTTSLIIIGETLLKKWDYDKTHAYFDEVLKIRPNIELALKNRWYLFGKLKCSESNEFIWRSNWIL